MCGAVIGVIAIIAVQLLKSSVEGSVKIGEEGNIKAVSERLSKAPAAAVLYILALAAIYKFTNKFATLLMLVSGAIAGQFLFV